MARPREFDEREALLQAMQVFWSNGFEATSLTDLLKATGLSKSSLYDTFGSKRELFLAAFEVYRLERMRMLDGYLKSKPTAFASIRAFFEMVVEHARLADRPFGCMSCNEAVEFGPHDEEVQQLIARDFLGIEDALAHAVERGKADGSIPGDKDARKLARFLTVTHQGLQVMARSKANIDRLDDALGVMLQALQ
ncbi:TetR/AcrR family transcriptional regulator [Paraburkholderia sp. BL10I2N1]|uniref:TetR/AcrR family transcriptional regulator n=1 Tax=Paraburkholderia sp. BL10I2N1 TaxID=1938796 RepID=UPI00105F6367|nr:TetR/AcrR family transcriptional regulator [Paraburkholderia sp. BL10I2N1]TDN70016.1 TetR family transcriptional regulator [Paraburkholderia sp. BL10I2N1]